MNKTGMSIRDQAGVSLAIVLCIGALLVTLSAVLVRSGSNLTDSARRTIEQERAYQLAVSFSDQLKASLCTDSARQDSLGAFLDQHFLTPEYGAEPLTLDCAEQTAEEYGQISLTLEKQQLPMTRTFQLSRDGWEPALPSPEGARVADYLVQVTVTATLPEASFSYTESYHRWVDCTDVYAYEGASYRYAGNLTFQPAEGAGADLVLSGEQALVCRFEPKQAADTGYTSVAEEWYDESKTAATIR